MRHMQQKKRVATKAAQRRKSEALKDSALQKQKEREKASQRKVEVLEEATLQYQREIEKENFQLSSPFKNAQAIANAIGKKHGTEVCYRTILAKSQSRTDINESKIDALKKEKKKRVEMARIDTAARKLLSKNIPSRKLKKNQLTLLLKWHGIVVEDLPNNHLKRLQKWLKVKANPLPSVPKWTLEEEAQIGKLESPDVQGKAAVDTPLSIPKWMLG